MICGMNYRKSLVFIVCFVLQFVQSKLCFTNALDGGDPFKLSIPRNAEKILIFPDLQLQCSGAVTHVRLTLDDTQTNFCDAEPENSIGFKVIFLKKLNEMRTFRHLAIKSFVLATGEVTRQCRNQDHERLNLEFSLDDNNRNLLVGQGVVLGLEYPVHFEEQSFRESTDGNGTGATSSIVFRPVTLYHASAVGNVFQTSSLPRLKNAFSAAQSNFSMVPLVDVNIRASSTDVVSDPVQSHADLMDSHFLLTVFIAIILVSIGANGICMAALLAFVCRRSLREKRNHASRHYYSYPDMKFRGARLQSTSAQGNGSQIATSNLEQNVSGGGPEIQLSFSSPPPPPLPLAPRLSENTDAERSYDYACVNRRGTDDNISDQEYL